MMGFQMKMIIFWGTALLLVLSSSGLTADVPVTQDQAFCDVCTCSTNDDGTVSADCDPDNLDFTHPFNYSHTPTNVTYLDISFGFSTVNLVDDLFSSMGMLEELNFYLQEVDEIAPGAFRGLPRLSTLLLSYNELKDFPVIPLGHVCASLTRLNVTHQFGITDLDADSLRGFSHLITLDLTRIHLTRIHALAFRGLVSLRHLILYDNDLTALEDGAFADLLSLEFLNLRLNYLTGVPLAVDTLHSLTALDFSYNPVPFDFRDFKFITHMPNITSLEFVNCTIRRISASAVANLKRARQLTKLYLYDNPYSCTSDLCAFIRYYLHGEGIDFKPPAPSPSTYTCSLPSELHGYVFEEIESTLCPPSPTSTSTTTWTSPYHNVTSTTIVPQSASSNPLSPSRPILKTTMIIAIVVGSVIALVVIALTSTFVVMRRKRRANLAAERENIIQQ